MKNVSNAPLKRTRYERDHRARRSRSNRPSAPSASAVADHSSITAITSSKTSRAPRGSNTSSVRRSTSTCTRRMSMPAPATPSPCIASPRRRHRSGCGIVSPAKGTASANLYGACVPRAPVTPVNAAKGSSGSRRVRGGTAIVVTTLSSAGTAATSRVVGPSPTARISTRPLSRAIIAITAWAPIVSFTGASDSSDTGDVVLPGSQRANRAG